MSHLGVCRVLSEDGDGEPRGIETTWEAALLSNNGRAAFVIPAKAGIQALRSNSPLNRGRSSIEMGARRASSAALKELASVQAFWIPAFAGKTPLASRDVHWSEIRDDLCLVFEE